MSFTYEYAYFSGYSTGTTGIEKFKSLSYFVSGLKYDGTGINITKYYWFTGFGIIGSGTIGTELSGRLNYDSDEQYWRADVSIPSGATTGETATGLFTFVYNTGAIAGSTGWSTTGFIRIFGSKALDAWNLLTLEDGVKDNADSLHSHSAYAQNLTDLDDVALPGTIDDGDALIYNAASGGWTTGQGAPADWEAVSGEVAEITGAFPSVSGSHSSLSGVVADYPVVSGAVSTIDNNYVKTDATRGITGTMQFSGAIYIGDIAGGDYFKLWLDGSNLRIDSIGGSTIIVSGNVSGVDGSKIYGAVLL